jgi:hypothetical protein
MSNNNITCLEFDIKSDKEKGFKFNLVEEGVVNGDGSRVIILKKGIKSVSSKKIINIDSINQTEPLTNSIFGPNRPNSPSSSTHPNPLTNMFAQLFKAPQ